MTRVEWDESLSVGIELIDDQHKMLIQRLNDLSAVCSSDADAQKVMKTLDFMIEYTDFHFSTEEKVMEEEAFPGMEYHVEKHGEFRKVLNDLLQDYEEEGGTSSLLEAIDNFLVNWLLTHIKGTDVEFGDFLREKGATELEAGEEE